MQRIFSILPAWLVFVISLLLVALIGVIDYLTGDYSILIFYLLPIALAAWYVGKMGGVAMAAAAGVARIVSDHSSFTNSAHMYWNSAEEMIFLLIVALLIATIKRQLNRD